MRILLDNLRLIDPSGDLNIPNGWLLLKENLIDSYGTDRDPQPPADEIIDFSGCSVLPGLFNLHVHIQRRHLALPNQGAFRLGAPAVENAPDTRRIVWAIKNAWRELLSGVTTIRDCGSKNRVSIDLRHLIKDGDVKGPAVLASGFGIAATGGHETHRYKGAVEVDGPTAVRAAVRAEIKAGADFIKFMGSGGIGGMPEHEDPDWIELGEDELAAGIREAHNRGKKTTVHAMGAGAVLAAIKAGIDCIEHGVNLNEEIIDLMLKLNVHYVPTFSGIKTVALREKDNNPPFSQLITERVVEPLSRSIRLAHRAGILIGCGTDTLGDVVSELEFFEECGLSTLECLATATGNAARICGLDQVKGSLKPGFLADLAVVKGNPLLSLDALRNVQAVFLRGQKIDKACLINL